MRIRTNDYKSFIEAREKELEIHSKKPVITGKPGGMLRIELFGASLPARYRQHLNIADAECIIEWTPFGYVPPVRYEPDMYSHKVKLTSFIHSSINVLCVKIENDMAGGWGSGIRFGYWREEDPAFNKPEIREEGNYRYILQELGGGEYFVLMADVSGGEVDTGESRGRIEGIFTPGGKAGYLYLTIVTSRDSNQPVKQAIENLELVKGSDWEELEASHREWWHNYWRRGYVSTPFDTVEKYWYYALYLQGSICRPGRLSPGLQGNWIKENYPAWNADFHNNINMQVLNWGHYTANRLELGEPLYRLLNDVLAKCKAETNRYFGMEGARYPISMGPDGADTCGSILLSIYIGAGGWLSHHLWWHYKMTGDKEFLRKYCWPVLKECALFYADYLIKEEDGTYSLFPTLHMEAVCSQIAGAGKNSIWDLSVVTRCFQLALMAAEELGEATDLQEKFRNILEHLAPIPANEEGIWLEFSDRGGLWHMWDWARMMPIFPSELVSKDSGPELLRQQAMKTIEEYYNYRGAEAEKVVGFCGILFACALFRMGMAERGLKMAEYVCKTLNPSGFVASRDGWFFQVDTPPGLSVMLNEMLLQSYDGIIRVFPAVPLTDRPVRFHSFRAQGGFLVSAERREGKTMYLVIQSLCGNELKLLNPFVNEGNRGVEVKVYLLPQQKEVLESVEKQGRTVPFLDDVYLPGQLISFPTEKGQIYLISKEIPYISNI
ncbi:MAG: hypothetical protein NC929_04295, partial [Candidatus Omnitrophica bacterium]|nr:hypothetical protein [Candidatus Omnitrophota bacterium]